jgi:hypothetical protein
MGLGFAGVSGRSAVRPAALLHSKLEAMGEALYEPEKPTKP